MHTGTKNQAWWVDWKQLSSRFINQVDWKQPKQESGQTTGLWTRSPWAAELGNRQRPGEQNPNLWLSYSQKKKLTQRKQSKRKQKRSQQKLIKLHEHNKQGLNKSAVCSWEKGNMNYDTGPWWSPLLHTQGRERKSSYTTSDQIRPDQSLSRVQLFATPWIAARQASLSITNSRSSLRLTSIESVMPSSHLILCCPLLLLPPIPPSIRVFSNESALHQVAKVLALQLQHQSFQCDSDYTPLKSWQDTD